VVLLAALVLGLFQEDAVRKLIEQLSSDKIEIRADAYRKLEAIGRPALALLEKASADSDGEVASRARTLLVRIPIRERLTPSLLSAVDGIFDRLALGDWVPVFLDLTADLRQPPERRRYPGVRAEDLAFMAPSAVDGARTEADRIAVCQAVGRLQLKTAIPNVVGLLKDERFVVRSNAVGAIRDADARDQALAIRPLLGDPHPLVRSVAAHALGKLGDQEAVPGLRKLLDDENANVRWWAVQAIGELKARDAAQDLRRLEDDPNDAVRRIATETLSQLRQKP
jgi:HEAT repeat protein